MLTTLLNYINMLPPGSIFTFKDICIGCFGSAIGNPNVARKLATEIQNQSFKSCGYIIISSTQSGANLYKKI